MNDILKDEQFLPMATVLVAQAKKSIYIATFKAEITSKRRGRKLKAFFDIIAEQADKGVTVHFITNRKDTKGRIPDSNAYAVRYFGPTKIKVRCLPDDRVCHAKLLIVDKDVAICGSHNLSVKACHNNFEVSCLLTEEQPVLLLLKAFEQLWDTAKEI